MNYFFPLFAVLIWSGNNVVNRLAVGVLFPLEIGFYRWLLAGLVLTPFLALPLWRCRDQVRPHLAHIVVLGLLGMVAYQTLAYYAATLTTATNLGIILSLMPLMALGLSMALLGAPLTRGALLGTVISLVGVVLVVSGGHPRALLDQGVNLGDLLMIVATFAYAIYGVLFKRWQPPLPTLVLLYLQVLVAIVFQLPLFLASPHHGLNPVGVRLIAYAGLAASVVAPILWMVAITRIGPSRVTLFFNLVPVFTALIAAWLLGERITGALFLGGALTLAGVILAERWKRPLRGAAEPVRDPP